MFWVTRVSRRPWLFQLRPGPGVRGWGRRSRWARSSRFCQARRRTSGSLEVGVEGGQASRPRDCGSTPRRGPGSRGCPSRSRCRHRSGPRSGATGPGGLPPGPTRFRRPDRWPCPPDQLGIAAPPAGPVPAIPARPRWVRSPVVAARDPGGGAVDRGGRRGPPAAGGRGAGRRRLPSGGPGGLLAAVVGRSALRRPGRHPHRSGPGPPQCHPAGRRAGPAAGRRRAGARGARPGGAGLAGRWPPDRPGPATPHPAHALHLGDDRAGPRG